MPVDARLTYGDDSLLPNNGRWWEIVDKDPREFQKPEHCAAGSRKRAKNGVTAW
jgi:hypothetical protein